jgi:hypothetical protein
MIPARGTSSGGTVVTLLGANLVNYGLPSSERMQCRFGERTVPLQFHSASSVSCTAPGILPQSEVQTITLASSAFLPAVYRVAAHGPKLAREVMDISVRQDLLPYTHRLFVPEGSGSIVSSIIRVEDIFAPLAIAVVSLQAPARIREVQRLNITYRQVEERQAIILTAPYATSQWYFPEVQSIHVLNAAYSDEILIVQTAPEPTSHLETLTSLRPGNSRCSRSVMSQFTRCLLRTHCLRSHSA